MDEPRTHHPDPRSELLASLEHAHERIERRLEELARAVDGVKHPSRARRRDLLRRVDHDLRTQHRIEERLLYPRLDGRTPEVRQALDEHRHTTRLLDELAELDPTTAVWERRTWNLIWTVETHHVREEDDVFALARPD